jgi:hypothetical protein
MFTIVHNPGPRVWMPLVDSETVYVGSIVSLDNSAPTEGVRPIPVAAGASNTTNKDIPIGVVVGTNNRYPLFNTTYKTEYITDATPHGSTTEFVNVEGPWAKGDRQAMVLVEIIDPSSVIRGPLFDSDYGTVPTVGTVTTGNTDGLGCTTGAIQVATVAVYSTAYFRSGANRGAYRIMDSASTTTHTWDKPTVHDIAIGDTLVAVNLRTSGISRIQLDSEAMFIDIDEAVTADYFLVDVVRLDLSEPGNEYAEFRFNMDNFTAARA